MRRVEANSRERESEGMRCLQKDREVINEGMELYTITQGSILHLWTLIFTAMEQASSGRGKKN